MQTIKKSAIQKPLAGLEASLLSWEDWPAKEVEVSECRSWKTPDGVVWLEDLISELRSLIMKMSVELSRFKMIKMGVY